MNSKSFGLTLIVVLVVMAGAGFRFESRSDLPLSHDPLTDLVLHPADPSQVLVASSTEVFLRGEKQSWKRLFSIPGKTGLLRHLIVHPRLPETVFLVTEEGILEGNLKRGRSKWIFKEANPPGNRVHAFALDPRNPDHLFVGTERGLFQSRDGGRTWLRPFRWPENQPMEWVGFLPSQPSTLLLGSRGELFFSKDEGDSFESGFSLPLFSREEEILEESEEGKDALQFTSFAFSSRDPSQLWVGTLEGVFESRDGGTEWEKLSDRGLEQGEVRDLVFSDSTHQLIAATSRTVARFHPGEKRWENLPVGLAHPPSSLALRSLPGNGGEMLLIASGGELVEWGLSPLEVPDARPPFFPSPERLEKFQTLVVMEPTVREIQKAALRYGNMGNGKIKRWHWGSRMRAFVPRLTFSKDFNLNENIDVDRGGANDPDKFISGPPERDEGWDLGLSWELGDFLYSTAQTSIDSREKLLVELRESILSQVTRIYFERRRVQMEIALTEPGDLQQHFDLLLRLEELTAQLDALTEGYLSRRLEEIEAAEPEFKAL